jgi:hypothetical protein
VISPQHNSHPLPATATARLEPHRYRNRYRANAWPCPSRSSTRPASETTSSPEWRTPARPLTTCVGAPRGCRTFRGPAPARAPTRRPPREKIIQKKNNNNRLRRRTQKHRWLASCVIILDTSSQQQTTDIRHRSACLRAYPGRGVDLSWRTFFFHACVCVRARARVCVCVLGTGAGVLYGLRRYPRGAAERVFGLLGAVLLRSCAGCVFVVEVFRSSVTHDGWHQQPTAKHTPRCIRASVAQDCCLFVSSSSSSCCHRRSTCPFPFHNFRLSVAFVVVAVVVVGVFLVDAGRPRFQPHGRKRHGHPDRGPRGHLGDAAENRLRRVPGLAAHIHGV